MTRGLASCLDSLPCCVLCPCPSRGGKGRVLPFQEAVKGRVAPQRRPSQEVLDELRNNESGKPISSSPSFAVGSTGAMKFPPSLFSFNGARAEIEIVSLREGQKYVVKDENISFHSSKVDQSSDKAEIDSRLDKSSPPFPPPVCHYSLAPPPPFPSVESKTSPPPPVPRRVGMGAGTAREPSGEVTGLLSNLREGTRKREQEGGAELETGRQAFALEWVPEQPSVLERRWERTHRGLLERLSRPTGRGFALLLEGKEVGEENPPYVWRD